MKYNEEELITRAISALQKRIGTQGAASSSTVETVGGEVFVAVRNVGGLLAVYALDGDQLRWVDAQNWPSGIGPA